MGGAANLKISLLIAVLVTAVVVVNAEGKLIYVDADANGFNDGSSWENAYNYLQDALTDAGASIKPVEIRVARGIYKPDMDEAGNVTPGDREATFRLINGVALRGGYAGYSEPDPNAWDIRLYETILTGDLDANDVGDLYDISRDENAYHVVTGTYTEPNAVLEGFTITAGKTPGGGSASDFGAGMYNASGSPTVTNCTFTRNYANWGGGGMFNSYSSTTLTNCVFSENYGGNWGGGLYNGSSNPILTNCTFIENWGYGGGGMYNAGGSPVLTNCTFIGNSVPSATLLMYSVNSSESNDIHPTFLYPPGGGMYNTGSSPTLVNCTFSGNSADNGGGMASNSYSSPIITNCTFSGNSARLKGGGMWINYESAPIMNNCILWADSAPTGAEISLVSSTLTVSYCDVKGGAAGVYADSGSTLNWGNGNITTDPLFVDSVGPDGNAGTEDDNLRLLADSPCIDAGNNTAVPEDANDLDGDANTTELIPLDLDNYRRFEDFPPPGGTGVAAPGYPNIVDMGAYERHLIIFVDNDVSVGGDGMNWETAYKYLQDALHDAGPGDEIRVAAGNYYPDEDEGANVTPDDRTETFQLINGVVIYGGYAGFGEPYPNARDIKLYETILSGDINTPGDNSDNSYQVVSGSGTDATAVINGFTITAGNANGPIMYKGGGGIDNYQGSPTVANCTFSGNSAGWGGGMINWEGSNPIVTNCTFTDNSAKQNGGGIYNQNGSNPVVTNCTFRVNTSANIGGGMCNWRSSPTVTNCTFTGNSADQSGGGMDNRLSSCPTITNCTFSGNSVGLCQGGGMYNYLNSSPTINNCAFSGNSAGQGGGMYNYDSSPTLTNCIIWGNSSFQIYNVSSSPTVTYSDVQGSYPGEGNKNLDPLFVDADGLDDIFGTEDDNLRLSPGSPCIDAGDNAPVNVTTDLDGNPRFVDGDCNDTTIVDMGAYEFAYAYIGDFDSQCDVDFADYAIFALAWLTKPGDAKWNPACDIGIPADNHIDCRDLDAFANNWLVGK